MGYTFESQLAAVYTFAVKSYHRADGIVQPIYVERYILVLVVDVVAAGDCLVQSLPQLLLDFCFSLEYVVEVIEDFAQRRGCCISTEELLYGFRPASDAALTQLCTYLSMELLLGRLGQEGGQGDEGLGHRYVDVDHVRLVYKKNKERKNTDRVRAVEDMVLGGETQIC